MSAAQQPPFQYSPVAQEPVAARTRPVAWVALGLAVLGFIFACIPGLSLVAWLLLVPAFVVSIVAVAQKGKKAVPVIALILSIVGGIIAVIVSIVTVANSVGDAVDEGTTTWTVDGAVATSNSGIVFTVDSVECGLAEYGDAPFDEVAKGEFCVVSFTVENGSDEPLSLSTNNIKGLLGGNEYDAESSLGGFGDDLFATTLNPGLTTDGTSVIDVPAGSTLESVGFAAGYFLDDGATVPVP